MSNLTSGTGFYAQVFNTTVSGSKIRNALAELDADNARGSSALVQLNRQPVIDLGSGTFFDLTALNMFNVLQEGLVGEIMVDASQVSNVTGTVIQLGPDAASNAARYIQYFNLRSTNDIRVLTFQLSGAIVDGITGGTGVSLGNTSGTSNNVAFTLDGVSTGSSQLLIPFTGLPGDPKRVEVSASNLTSGSEVVQFNVLSA